MLDLRAKIVMNTSMVGYAVTYVYTPKAMDTVLLLGSDETVTVWLNGTEIHKKRIYRRITPDADTIPCQLKADGTRLCVALNRKVGRGHCICAFLMQRVCLNIVLNPKNSADSVNFVIFLS